jgi:pyroglutamyl-peptidase
MLERLYERENPALALHFGVSANARGLVLERRAVNVQSVTADAAGLLPKSQKVVEHGPSVLKTQLPVQRIAKALESCAIPASLSDNAGTYLCNAVFFRSLLLAQTVRPACRSGFIHIPADLPASDLSMERTLAGALHIVRITLEID